LLCLPPANYCIHERLTDPEKTAGERTTNNPDQQGWQGAVG